ncbi:hypothetical protein Goari_026837, partial [Gossypium aridum]|nr:hypothetical protein [Gossypium aridum]
VNLVPTVEGYTTLLRFLKIQANKAYSRAANVPTFLKRLMSIMVMNEAVEWRAPWMIPDEILYRCGNFDWVPLLGIWGVIRYAPLLVLSDTYKKKLREISNAWNQTHRMKRFIANPITTSEYDWWWGKRVIDNVPMSNQENTRSIEEHLPVILSELEIVKQDFEKRSLELGRKIKKLEEKNIQLGLDVDV